MKWRADHPKIKQVLDDTGLQYEVRQGSKHRKIFLSGRLIDILPRGKGYDQIARNVIANIRRQARKSGL